jgi:DNA-binding transcriptional ArsR family regulator
MPRADLVRSRAMATTFQIAELASHLGEPPRAAMLAALMDGRALTATELAGVAGITPQTASSHLARLTTARLLRVSRQGRHRYHRLASPEVARMLEGLMQLASDQVPRSGKALALGPRDAALREARTCYDHLAGRLGVAIAEALIKRGAIELEDDAGIVTKQGIALFRRAGIAFPDGGSRPAGRSSRPLCRPCLDWSERRVHLAGRLGAAICHHSLDKRWVRRLGDTRALGITAAGRGALRAVFGIGRLD